MVITATKKFQKIVFTWNEDLSECKYNSINVNDDEIDELISHQVHEGKDFDGWNVEIK